MSTFPSQVPYDIEYMLRLLEINAIMMKHGENRHHTPACHKHGNAGSFGLVKWKVPALPVLSRADTHLPLNMPGCP